MQPQHLCGIILILLGIIVWLVIKNAMQAADTRALEDQIETNNTLHQWVRANYPEQAEAYWQRYNEAHHYIIERGGG